MRTTCTSMPCGGQPRGAYRGLFPKRVARMKVATSGLQLDTPHNGVRRNGQSVTGKAKYRLPKAGLCDAAQRQYFRFCERRLPIQHWMGRPPRMNPLEEGMGEDSAVWIIYEYKVVGISESATQGGIGISEYAPATLGVCRLREIRESEYKDFKGD